MCKIRGLCEPSPSAEVTSVNDQEEGEIIASSGISDNSLEEEPEPAVNDEETENPVESAKETHENEIASLTKVVEGSLVNFNFDSYQVSDLKHAENLIKTLNQLISYKGEIKLKITGYTCDLGPDEYNQQLGLKRAQSMKDYLISQNIKIDIQVSSQGESNPLVPNSNSTNRSRNRRVEFSLEYPT